MKKVIQVVVFSCICIALVVGFYFYLSNKVTSTEETSKTEISEMDEVLNKNFATDYPQTPRAVIKWYNRIITLYYNKDTTDTQVIDLCDQAMMLMDSALVQNNPRDTYIQNVKTDIADYADHKRKIVQSDVCSTDEVEYKTIKKDEMAYVVASYSISEGSSFSRTYQKFALRKNKDGEWKILAFQLTDKDGTPISEDTSK